MNTVSDTNKGLYPATTQTPPRSTAPLAGLGVPLLLLLAAAALNIFVAATPTGSAQTALFGSWLLCVVAALQVVRLVPAPFTNEIGQEDAAQLFTIAWFVLLTSGMAAGSMWNVWAAPPGPALSAFIAIPASVWILAGITLLSNLGVRSLYRLADGACATSASTGRPTFGLLAAPFDSENKPNMAAAQYLIFNLIGIVVYGVAVAKIFSEVTGRHLVPDFPSIPPEVLGLMAVSGAGLVGSGAARYFQWRQLAGVPTAPPRVL